MLTNSGSANPAVLESRIARAMLGIEEKVVAVLPLSPADATLYVGVYNPGRGPIRVLLVEGELRALGATLQRVGEHEFVVDGDPYQLVTFTVEDGQAVSMTIQREGPETVAPRVSQ